MIPNPSWISYHVGETKVLLSPVLCHRSGKKVLSVLDSLFSWKKVLLRPFWKKRRSFDGSIRASWNLIRNENQSPFPFLFSAIGQFFRFDRTESFRIYSVRPSNCRTTVHHAAIAIQKMHFLSTKKKIQVSHCKGFSTG